MCTVLCYVKRISNAFSPHFIAKTDYYRTQAHVLFTAFTFHRVQSGKPILEFPTKVSLAADTVMQFESSL